MNRINNILSSVIFKRILIIFVVGLVSRSVVNLVFDINVFKEYTEVISLIYYGFMACFTGFVYELPQISFNVFNFDLVRSAIRSVFKETSFLFSGKMLCNDYMFIDNMNISKINENSVYKQESSDRVTYGRIQRFKSAGLRGLYGDPGNRNIVHSNSENNIKDYSFRNKLKCRVM